MRIVVVGGGIGGLSAAYYLAMKHQVVLIEKGRIGGWVHSKKTPHLLELGPRSLRPTGIPGAHTLDLAFSLGLEKELVLAGKKSPSALNRFILWNNELHRLPSSLFQFATSRSPLLKGMFWRLLLEPFKPRGPESESVDSFITRRLGANVSNRLVSAMVHGIYAGDHTKLEVQATLPLLPSLERENGSIILAMINRAFNPTIQPQFIASSPAAQSFIEKIQSIASIYSFKNGIQALTDSLEDSLRRNANVQIIKGSCTAIDIDTKLVDYVSKEGIQSLQSDFVVSAIPAKNLSEIICASSTASSKAIRKIRALLDQITSANVCVVNLVYTGKNLLQIDGFGFLVPVTEAHKTSVLGVVFDSCAIPEQDSNNKVTRLTVMIKYLENATNAKMLRMALDIVEMRLGIAPELLQTSLVTFQMECIPQYVLGHLKRINEIEGLITNSRLDLAIVGASYKGVAINDIVMHSRKMATLENYNRPRYAAVRPSLLGFGRSSARPDFRIATQFKVYADFPIYPQASIQRLIQNISQKQVIHSSAYQKDFDSAAKEKDGPFNHLIYGSISGALGKFIEHPFDTVKVNMQTQQKMGSTWMCIQKIYQNQGGAASFYRGISGPLAGSMLETSVIFLVYNQTSTLMKNNAKDREAPLSISQLSFAGAVAGAVVSFVLTPVELIKCQLQVAQSNNSQRGVMGLLSDTLKQRGIAGLYRGHIGTLLRETSGGAAWFGIYEAQLSYFLSKNPEQTRDTISPVKLAFAGALAGIGYNSALFPADTVKSIIQTSNKSLSFVEVSKKLYANSGVKGFYRGFGITLLRSAPTSGAMFLVYEMLCRSSK